jgi:hypothetical protein
MAHNGICPKKVKETKCGSEDTDVKNGATMYSFIPFTPRDTASSLAGKRSSILCHEISYKRHKGSSVVIIS